MARTTSVEKPGVSPNHQLQSFLKNLAASIAAARRRDELTAILAKVTSFGRPLKYNNRIYWIGLIVAVLLSGFAGLYLYTKPYNTAAMCGVGAGGLGALIFAVLIYMRRNTISRLSDALFQKDVYLDNGWDDAPFQGKRLAAQLAQQFNEFKRGNHLREIEWLVRGQFQGTEHEFEYHAYRFHYVDRRQVTTTTTGSKGRMRIRTRTVYDHFYRYGLYLPFEFVKGITISSSWFGSLFGSTYKPASIEFNRHFKVAAQSEMDAAKFLKPAVVVEIEDLRKELSGLNMEFSSHGQLCVSFEHNIYRWQRQHGFDEPTAFSQEIQKDQKIIALHQTLQSIHTILRHSDHNF